MSRMFTAMSIEGPDGSQVPLMLAGYRKVTGVAGFSDVRARTTSRPAVGRDGQINSSRYRDERLLTVTGLIVDETSSDPGRVWSEWDQVQAALGAAVDTDRLLMWESDNARALQALVRLDDVSVPVEVGPNLLRYQAQFRCPSGVAASQALQVVTITSPALSGGGGMTMPAAFPVTFLPVSASTVAALNEGASPAAPVLVLHGMQRNPSIVCGGRRLVIQGDIAAGDELWLDAAARTVLLNGDPAADRRSMLRSAMSRWFTLPPGVPAQVGLQVQDFDGGASLDVRFRHTY